ncbi:MAG TPA: hypothetical protein VG826_11335 [Pirellulales bacterium]|nr:hypothetical protein [Pirellulales bacterium]
MPKVDPLEAFDGWELDEKLEHVRRVLDMSPFGEALDSRLSTKGRESRRAPEAAAHSSVAWVLAKLAVAAVTCGGILAAWWWITDRHDLVKPALASLALGHLAWLVKWCWEANPAIEARMGNAQVSGLVSQT